MKSCAVILDNQFKEKHPELYALAKDYLKSKGIEDDRAVMFSMPEDGDVSNLIQHVGYSKEACGYEK